MGLRRHHSTRVQARPRVANSDEDEVDQARNVNGRGPVTGTRLPIVLVTAGTVCGLAATDLVLPAIPVLPDLLDGTAETAQWVLAAFVFGNGLGLLLFGELGGYVRVVHLLTLALLAFAALSLAATQVESLTTMAALRFFQGISAAAPAVYAPVLVRNLYDVTRGMAMMGRLGSIESMAPAIAPIVGAALLSAFGWASSFYLLGAVAGALGLTWLLSSARDLRIEVPRRSAGGYLSLFGNGLYLRYALSQAGNLGALLVLVFAAPKVITSSLGGELRDFVIMQVMGITLFVIAANMTGRFTRWWGDHETVLYGTILSAVGCCGMVLLSLLDAMTVPRLWALFLAVNLGLGIRGPIGFYKALAAAGDNDARGSALLLLVLMLITGGGTALVAGWIEQGWLPVSATAAVIAVLAAVLVGRRPAP